MDMFLQLWGGAFYLINKMLFSIAETQHSMVRRKQLKVLGWMIYILGVPPWVIILVSNDNWIAASIEAGGLPAMMFGSYRVMSEQASHRFYDQLTSWITYCFVALGVGYSFYRYGGIISLTQCLELGVMIGFLVGGYLLAKEQLYGWLCFALMNMSMGALMFIQAKPILGVQQGVSLGFVILGMVSMAKNQKAQQCTSFTD